MPPEGFTIFAGKHSQRCPACSIRQKAMVKAARIERDKYKVLPTKRELAEKEWNRKRKLNNKPWGISFAEYEVFVAKQEGKCSICLTIPPEGQSLFVDHDHTTEQFRGIICHWCNAMLGYAKDNPATLRRGATYVEPSIALAFGNQ